MACAMQGWDFESSTARVEYMGWLGCSKSRAVEVMKWERRKVSCFVWVKAGMQGAGCEGVCSIVEIERPGILRVEVLWLYMHAVLRLMQREHFGRFSSH
jgi:hypothetical protein